MALVTTEKKQAAAIDHAIAAVKAYIQKGDHAADKAEQYYRSAGQHLEELKEVGAHKVLGLTWEHFTKEKCGISAQRAHELRQIADGTISLAQLRESKKQSMSRSRLNESPQRVEIWKK